MLTGRYRWTTLFLVSAFLLFSAGCGSREEPSAGAVPAGASAEETRVPLPELEDLLSKPRAELAKYCDDLLTEIQVKERARREGRLTYALLDTYVPVVWPVFHEAKFNAELGVSVPAYADLKDRASEREVWVQYARFGDYEAAAKLGGESLASELKALKLERNYPIEWTRLVAMQLHVLQVRIATGEGPALAALIGAHRQVEKILDARAKEGLLGQTLLPRGKRTLELAAAAWRQKRQTSLAEHADKALSNWSASSLSPPSWKQPKAHWISALKAKAEGTALVANPAARALDLMQLPFPADAADAAVLAFDSRDQLAGVLLMYSQRARQHLAVAGDFASVLTDHVSPAADSTNEMCLHRWGNWIVQTGVCRRSPTFGAWVRVTSEAGAIRAPLPRDLGGIHLDRSFEQNRLRFAPTRLGDAVVADQEAEVKEVANPLSGYPLRELVLVRLSGKDMLEEARLRYLPQATYNIPFHQVALPLIGRLGIGQPADEPAERTHRAHMRMTWTDPQTEVALRIPHDDKEPAELAVRDRRDPATATDERAAAVATFERNERGQRLKSGKPFQRLPRTLEQFALGHFRNQVLNYIPRGRYVYRRDFVDGVNAAINMPAAREQPFVYRQFTVRFDKNDRLWWARVRYEANPAFQGRPVDWPRALLQRWRAAGGAVASTPSPFAPRMADLPPLTPAPTFYRWQDDLTEVTYYASRGGVEITIHNRPVDSDGVTRKSFSYLPRGPEGLLVPFTLGLSRSEVEARLVTKAEITPDGSWLHRPEEGPFDAVLFYFEEEKLRRIAARYRQEDNPKTAPKEMQDELKARWGSDLEKVGWPARLDYYPPDPTVVQAMTWLDDVTRYRLYWAESENSPSRLWGEWRDDSPR